MEFPGHPATSPRRPGNPGDMGDMGELRSRFSTAIARGLAAAPEAAHATMALAVVDDWMPWLPEAGQLLDARERGRAGRMKRPRDAAARTLAYALHRLFLGALTGIDARDLPLGRDDRGRPVLGGDWCTSLSHADGAFACAALRAAPVGIDLERRDRAAGIADIESDICHPDESAALAGLPDHLRAHALLDAWARKEAYLKASGVGLAHPMAAFALPEGGILPLTGDSDTALDVQTGLVALHPDYVVALSRPPGTPVHTMRLLPD
ncbi:4'-phosphopantetheinyl transferase superfamily protein [Luteimonas sp. MC1782]|uniref:4'-phosphopantetheinyl transferase family protein n=1 Tax=Luteimonas sp. MC1782 TaxID=2760305 RepID=UPI0016007999|nr:4'-phosphopantetheinyl transferase superfamily protein [Luteimonas sp. MC1782]MBB1473155.1 4'-phosphopantetheinyl transferase superfamily protein [Luteimonas sp. MC1782]